MTELKTSERSSQPFEMDRAFEEMFRRDRFVDGIPLDELQKHLRRTKTMKEYFKRRK
ncbi:hypothetical protein LCM20_16845 [Halobacillus litoralis]|uniref:hypothetical protein n=1 Tax=Halobacillus litoralis TaxID=45668 RepID=UPI001CD4FC8B|nr:hypothetical protein [Halobacillus litoralis]MCA0972279.1 hypothetical protein [Halobacillus litoralis]